MHVTMHDPAVGVGHCTCPDFLTNQLNTCKHPIHKELSSLKTGDILEIRSHNNRLSLVSPAGIPVARLSQKAAHHWQDKIYAIKEVKVLAMVKRYRTDIKESTFTGRCQLESWELPIVELMVDND